MKQLNNYIIEKLKLNKNTKEDVSPVQLILDIINSVFPDDPSYKKELDKYKDTLDKWETEVGINSIKELEIYCAVGEGYSIDSLIEILEPFDYNVLPRKDLYNDVFKKVKGYNPVSYGMSLEDAHKLRHHHLNLHIDTDNKYVRIIVSDGDPSFDITFIKWENKK